MDKFGFSNMERTESQHIKEKEMEGKDWKLPCGCSIFLEPNSPPILTYCPKHKSAPALYEALGRIKRNCFKDKRGAYWIGRVDMANAEQALAKAEGK